MELCSGKFLHHSKSGIPNRQERIWFARTDLADQCRSRNQISSLWVIKLQSVARHCTKTPEKQMHTQDKTICLFKSQSKRQYFHIISHQLEPYLNFKINTIIHWNCNRIPNDSKTTTLTESYPVDSASGLIDNSFTGLERWQLHLLNPWQVPRQPLTQPAHCTW